MIIGLSSILRSNHLLYEIENEMIINLMGNIIFSLFTQWKAETNYIKEKIKINKILFVDNSDEDEPKDEQSESKKVYLIYNHMFI